MTTADECLPFGVSDLYEYVREVKELHVAHWAENHGRYEPDSEPDIVPMVHFSYEEQRTQAAVVLVGTMDKDAALYTAHTMIGLTRPDTCTIVADTKVAASLENPATGEPWVQGEIRALGAGAADALVITTQWANGRSRMVLLSYVYDKHAGIITWGEPLTVDTGNDPVGEKVEGYMSDEVRAAFDCDCGVAPQELADVLGLDRERQVAHGIRVALPKFSDYGWIGMANSDNDLIQALLEEGSNEHRNSE